MKKDTGHLYRCELCSYMTSQKPYLERHKNIHMLNDDKTELMLIGTRQQLQKVNLNDITVGDTVVEAKSVVRNLGSKFHRNLDMPSHISKQCASICILSFSKYVGSVGF